MKKQKVLALVLSLVMVISMLAACGKNENGNDPAKDEVSIDFEDSKSAFALVKTAPRKADESSLSVKDVNGSKVLYVTNEKGGVEMYLALDLDGLLGANVSKLAKIEMSIGVDRTDSDKFTAISGKSYVYAGATAAELKETRLGDWAVYTSSKNPNTVTFDLSGVTMTAGADTYFLLNKDTDAGSTPANFYIDNVKFLDKDGKLIECNKNVVMEPVGKFIKEPEKPDVSAGITIKDEVVPAKWSQADCTVANSIFANFEGAIEITIKYDIRPESEGDGDYYLWALRLNTDGWPALANLLPGCITSPVNINGDGFFELAGDSTELTFTISADGLKKIQESGVDVIGSVHRVDVYEMTIKPAAEAAVITEKITDETKPANWSAAEAKVPAEVMAKFGDSVEITLKYEITATADGYWLWSFSYATADGTWVNILKDAAEGTYSGVEVNADGYLVIPSDKEEITFTVDAATVKRIQENGTGFFGSVHDVDVYEIVIKGLSK